MTPEETLSQRLQYLGIEDEDLEALARARPLLEKHADSFISAFYRHLLAFEPTRKLLADPHVKERLLAKQRSYLLSLTNGRIDQEYVAERIGIGQTHHRVGLEPRWYLGAYSLYFNLLTPIVHEEFTSDRVLADRVVSALMKVLMLDAQLAMESYIGQRESQLEYLADELATSSRTLERSFQEQGVELRETTQRAHAAEHLASIGTLVAGLAHEIGTPMGVIQGHAEQLKSSIGADDERGSWRLTTIREQIDRISNIMQTLLDMARPRAADHVPVDLGAVVRSSLDFIGEKLRSRDVRVQTAISDGAVIIGDEQKLQQLLLNLLLNAADSMPNGGELRVELTPPRAGEVQLEIADSGVGIPADSVDRIYDPFFTTKPAGKGSGLGLMVVRNIVQEHGGALELESEEGVGTTFTILLPTQGR